MGTCIWPQAPCTRCFLVCCSPPACRTPGPSPASVVHGGQPGALPPAPGPVPYATFWPKNACLLKPRHRRLCAAGSRHPLFAGLLLTSALSDPFFGQPPLLRAAKTAYVTLLSWLVPALPMFARRPVETGIRCEAALVDMRSDRLWYRGKFKVGELTPPTLMALPTPACIPDWR